MNKLIFIVFIAVLGSLPGQAQPDFIPYRKGDQWGYCNPSKKILIPPQFEDAHFFASMYGKSAAKVKKNGKYGLIDQAGNSVLPFKYQDVGALHSDLIKVKTKGKWKLRHPKHRVKSGKYDKIVRYNRHYLMVKKRLKMGLIDLKGKKVISTRFDSLKFTDSDRWVQVVIAGKTGLYDLKKKKVVVPTLYTSIGVLENNTFVIRKNGKQGICTPDHKIILPVKYDDITVEGAHYSVELNGKMGEFDKKGKIITPLTEEVIEMNLDVEFTDDPPSPPSPKQAPNGKWGYKKGFRTIVPYKYDEVLPFDQRVKLAKVKYKGKWGYINLQGVEYFED